MPDYCNYYAIPRVILGDNGKSLQVGASLQGTIPSVIVAALRLGS